MARNNLGRILASISNLSTIPKLSPALTRSVSETVFVSNSVSRIIYSSAEQPQQENSANKEEQEESIKANRDEEEDENEDSEFVNKDTGEIGGPRGPEPTRYGDWERNGRCSDF